MQLSGCRCFSLAVMSQVEQEQEVSCSWHKCKITSNNDAAKFIASRVESVDSVSTLHILT